MSYVGYITFPQWYLYKDILLEISRMFQQVTLKPLVLQSLGLLNDTIDEQIILSFPTEV